MAFRFLGKWGKSPDGDSPSLWIDDENGDLILQGWRVDDPVARAELLATSGCEDFPEHETVIRFPSDMVALLPEVGDDDAGSDRR